MIIDFLGMDNQQQYQLVQMLHRHLNLLFVLFDVFDYLMQFHHLKKSREMGGKLILYITSNNIYSNIPNASDLGMSGVAVKCTRFGFNLVTDAVTSNV